MKLRHVLFLLVFTIFIAGCLAPGGGGPPPTPTATYTQAELKYLLLDHYGEDRFFSCDPDYYPVARDDEQERAIAAFPAIKNDTEVFAAITTRLGLHPAYSEDAKLAIYREYKKLRAIPLEPAGEGTFSFTLQLGTMGEGRRVSGIIRSDGVIFSEHTDNAVLTCPICLTGDTWIDTPAGSVRVDEMHEGMLVWTRDADGARKSVPVLKGVKKPVLSPFQIVHLTLSDGRELYASAGHPTTDGRTLGILTPGDRLDGASVIGADLEPAKEEYTYDILPDGDTGVYWANGIPLKSTLFHGKP